MAVGENALDEMVTKKFRSPGALIWVVAAVVVAGCAIRYSMQPTFWLDESFVAASLRDPTFDKVFAPLEYNQHFPRLYLSAIASLQMLFGYEIWSLRLLPFLCFIGGTLLMALLLARRSGTLWASAWLACLLLLGSSYWLHQAVQLKQYTFDVLLALIPFVISDRFYEESLAKSRYKTMLIILALPCLLSYSYPISLLARLAGWYVAYGRRRTWRLNMPAVSALAISASLSLAGIWLTDYRFNFRVFSSYQAYWGDCILSDRLADGLPAALKLIANFFWGWHGRMTMVTAGIAPLQVAGVYSIIRRWKRARTSDDDAWGSRSVGSIILIGGLILANLLVNYPICAGRTTLFALIHFQILAIEGLIFASDRYRARRAARVTIVLFIAIVAFHMAREYVRFITSEPSENLHPVVRLINPDEANTVLVHSCSVAQVRALPYALPVGNVLYGSKSARPPVGEKVWVLWSHLGADYCQTELEQLRGSAKSWQTIHEGPGRGLALAEF
jgi:hypothetical protein